MSVSRRDVVEAVRGAVEARSDVYALWDGGGVAHGRVDQWSDVDLQLDADDGATGPVFAAVERALEARFGVELRWCVPEPTWHGNSQRFYRLRGASEYLLVDLAVLRHSAAPHRHEREREGERATSTTTCPPRCSNGYGRCSTREAWRICSCGSRTRSCCSRRRSPRWTQRPDHSGTSSGGSSTPRSVSHLRISSFWRAFSSAAGGSMTSFSTSFRRLSSIAIIPRALPC